MRQMMNKRGQETMGLPFSLIFALFLIIIFIVMAFMAVKIFFDWGNKAGVGLFYEDLQKAVIKSQGGQSSESVFDGDLPSGIEKICFANLSEKITGSPEDYAQIEDYAFYEANTFLIPPEKADGMEWKQIKYLNITKITEKSNPYCVEASQDLIIKKGFYDRLVVIE